MITYINIDTILSDPLILTAAILLVVGPLLFFVSLWKLVRPPKKNVPLFDTTGATNEPFFKEEPKGTPSSTAVPEPPPTPLHQPKSPPAPTQPVEPSPSAPQPAQAAPIEIRRDESAEKTVVMPPGVAEVQGQLEIAFSQIKLLNKKVYELEMTLSDMPSNTAPVSDDFSRLKEPPANPADFMQKLLKLAEHVIVLEKHVSRLMGATRQTPNPTPAPTPKTQSPPSAPLASKPPIMPL
jgi:hypothetical protein